MKLSTKYLLLLVMLCCGVGSADETQDAKDAAEKISARIEAVKQGDLEQLPDALADSSVEVVRDTFAFLKNLSNAEQVDPEVQKQLLLEVSIKVGELIVALAEPFEDVVMDYDTVSGYMEKGYNQFLACGAACFSRVAHVFTALFTRDIASAHHTIPRIAVGNFEIFPGARDVRRTYALRRIGVLLREAVGLEHEEFLKDKGGNSLLTLAAYRRVIEVAKESEPLAFQKSHKLVFRAYQFAILWHLIMGPIIEPVFTRTRNSPAWGVALGVAFFGALTWIRRSNSGIPLSYELLNRSIFKPWKTPALGYYKDVSLREALTANPSCAAILDGISLDTWIEHRMPAIKSARSTVQSFSRRTPFRRR